MFQVKDRFGKFIFSKWKILTTSRDFAEAMPGNCDGSHEHSELQRDESLQACLHGAQINNRLVNAMMFGSS